MQNLQQGYRGFIELLTQSGLEDWQNHARDILDAKLFHGKHGDLPRWTQALADLPELTPSNIALDQDAVTIGNASDCNEAQHQALHTALKQLCPWRKGPWQFYDVFIDTEWRSDWKWQRLQTHIADLNGRRILDVGCGNGYYAMRMLAAGAKNIIGIDPSLLFVIQHLAVKHYLPDLPFYILPCGIDDLPVIDNSFDSVFSMGVIYHRRDPHAHLNLLHRYLQPQGELILETLVLDQDDEEILVPGERYARMRNVWHVPSIASVKQWLQQEGFINIRCVDVSTTDTTEQRSTEWMQYESLDKCLDPIDQSRTIEGYPAPVRAAFIANKP